MIRPQFHHLQRSCAPCLSGAAKEQGTGLLQWACQLPGSQETERALLHNLIMTLQRACSQLSAYSIDCHANKQRHGHASSSQHNRLTRLTASSCKHWWIRLSVEQILHCPLQPPTYSNCIQAICYNKHGLGVHFCEWMRVLVNKNAQCLVTDFSTGLCNHDDVALSHLHRNEPTHCHPTINNPVCVTPKRTPLFCIIHFFDTEERTFQWLQIEAHQRRCHFFAWNKVL